MSPIKVISHYGTKGMRWGVRKVRSGAKTFLTGDPKTSVLHPKGRAAAIAEGKAAVGKLSGSKAFKATVFDKNKSALTKSGRDKLAKAFKKNADKRYKAALKKEKNVRAAKEKRAKETRKMIEQMVKQDKATQKHFGKKFDEAGTRKVFEQFYKTELDVGD